MVKTIKKRRNHIAEIATLAYYKARSRGFEPGNELIDWIAAEQEVESVKEIVVQKIIVKPIVVKEIVIKEIDMDTFVAMQMNRLVFFSN